MRKLSAAALAKTVASRRKAMKITQAQLAETTGINRALLSRITAAFFKPVSIAAFSNA